MVASFQNGLQILLKVLKSDNLDFWVVNEKENPAICPKLRKTKSDLQTLKAK